MERASENEKKETSILAPPILALTRLAVRNPVQTLAFAVVLALFALFFAFTDLKMKTSRLDLINQKSEFNKLWNDYIEDFGDEDDLVVVVEGASQEAVTPVLDELSEKIGQHPDLFRAVLHEVDTTPLLRKGLHFVEKPADLAAVLHFAEQGRAIADGHWEYLSAENYLGGLCQKLTLAGKPMLSPEEKTELENGFRETAAFAGSLDDALAPNPTFRVSPLAPIREMGTLKREYFIADGGRLGVVLLKIAESKEGSFTYGTRSIETLREIIRESHAAHPETEIGLTGLTVMENDEMRLSQTASSQASVLSLIGVAVIFIAAFGGFRHPLIAVFALLIGIAWTMGYIVLSVGHLNILSMSFGVILVGLGIDFGIHYVSRYLETRRSISSPEKALLKTGATVGPGVVIGAMTTAAAFLMIGVSEFTGIAELGIVSGGGILLCCASAILLIPAMIQLTDGAHPERIVPVPVDLHRWMTPIFRFPKVVILLCLAATVYFAGGLGSVWYDHNLLHMQPENLESVQLEKKLLQKWDKGAWFALSLADSPEELLERKKEFEKDPTLRVDEIISRFPRTTPEKQAVIDRIRETLARLPEQPGMVPIGDALRLGTLLGETEALVERSASDLLSAESRRELLGRLAMARQALRQLTAEGYARRIGAFQQRLSGELLGRLHLIRLTASPEPPELSDLPESLVSRYVGRKSGKFLMRIYSTHEIWDMDKLEDFVHRVKAVDPNITGNPIQTYEASLQMQRSYKQASLLALLVIIPFLFLDFRSIKFTLLALVPMAVGVVWAFGLMGIFNIPFNPANTIVVPLILGIGIDDGVHIVHDMRQQKGRYRITPSLAGSVILTSLTTIIGFGSLMIADHRGLQSLGRVLVIGVSACTFTSIILMPALLSWLTRNRPEGEPVRSPRQITPSLADFGNDDDWDDEQECKQENENRFNRPHRTFGSPKTGKNAA